MPNRGRSSPIGPAGDDSTTLSAAGFSQRRSRRHDGYRRAPGEVPCESAISPLRQALPRPACNATTGLPDMWPSVRCVSRPSPKESCLRGATRSRELVTAGGAATSVLVGERPCKRDRHGPGISCIGAMKRDCSASASEPRCSVGDVRGSREGDTSRVRARSACSRSTC